MPKLDKAAILAADDLPQELVNVPEWGGEVLVRGLTAGERDRWEQRFLAEAARSRNPYDDLRAGLALLCVVDGDGLPMFGDDDLPVLTRKSAAALQRVYEAALRLSGIGRQDVEELRKNSSGAQADVSSSA